MRVHVQMFVRLSEVCAFVDPSNSWKLGKVIKLANYKEKKGSRGYSSNTVNISNAEKVGVLCSWYQRTNVRFTMVCSQHEQVFLPVTNYLCTITHACVNMFEGDTDCQTDSILQGNNKAIDFASAQHIS